MNAHLRFIREENAPELVNLYHLARAALSDKQDQSRHARMIWASEHFAQKYSMSRTAVYKDLCALLEP